MNYTNLNTLLGLMTPAPVPPRPSGITFGDRVFTEPSGYVSLFKLPIPALYAIMILDVRYKPRPYQVLYFGQAQNLRSRLTFGHEKYRDWLRAANGARLFVAYHPMPRSTETARLAAEDALIKIYQPACNERVNHSANAMLNRSYGL
jgi:hypothetical protein